MRRIGTVFSALLLVGAFAACGSVASSSGSGGDVTLDSGGGSADIPEALNESNSALEDGESGLEDFGDVFGDDASECVELSVVVGSAFLGFGAILSGSDVTELQEELDGFAARVPDEIADDLAVIADAYEAAAAAMVASGVDFNDPSTMTPDRLAGLDEVGEIFDSSEFSTAADNIGAFMEERCPAGAG